MKGRVSQRDIASLAGVSPMTVSLALRGHASIPAETRTRIQKIADKAGYRPDPALSALNAYRISGQQARFQEVIAWVTAFDGRDDWRSMVQTEAYFRGAAERAERLGYILQEFWVGDPTLNSKRASQILTARNIRCLIVAPLPPSRNKIELAWDSFSAVSLGYSLIDPHLHVVMNHQSRNMKHVMHHLSELGYRRIGMTMPMANDKRVDHNYLSGFLAAQCDMQSSAKKLAPYMSKNFDRDSFLAWFQKAEPDAVIVSAAWAERIMGWLRIEGIRVPEDVGLAVASVPFGNKFISGMDEDALLIGAMAVDTVVGMVHRNERGVPEKPCSILLDGVWTPGKTARKVRRLAGSL